MVTLVTATYSGLRRIIHQKKPETGHLRLELIPDKVYKISLTQLNKGIAIKEKDSQIEWFYAPFEKLFEEWTNIQVVESFDEQVHEKTEPLLEIKPRMQMMKYIGKARANYEPGKIYATKVALVNFEFVGHRTVTAPPLKTLYYANNQEILRDWQPVPEKPKTKPKESVIKAQYVGPLTGWFNKNKEYLLTFNETSGSNVVVTRQASIHMVNNLQVLSESAKLTYNSIAAFLKEWKSVSLVPGLDASTIRQTLEQHKLLQTLIHE